MTDKELSEKPYWQCPFCGVDILLYDKELETYTIHLGENMSMTRPNYCPSCGHKFNGEYRRIEREVVER